MKLQAYFQAYRNYFWQWEDSTEILAIPNGSTIAYKAFVLELIEQIAPTGTPPFGALLLLLIATNPTAEEDLKLLETSLKHKLSREEEKSSDQRQTFEFLAKIQALPTPYKTGAKRVLLFQTVFKNSHNHLSSKKARQILRAHEQHKEKFPHLILSQEKAFSIDALYKDIRVFEAMNKKFPTSKSILEAMANLPKIDEEELRKSIEENTETVDPNLLLEQLMDEPETFQIATLIKYLWSGLNLSFKKMTPNEQPLGGISDITNKGNFDRLLISEFAYDDLSFLSRLANNEALYLHREAPPSDNQLERLILMDVSLKNWGTPRTIAYAVLLALVYHPKAKTNCSAYAIGGHLMSKVIQFNSLDGIIHSLQFLDASLDCSRGLKSFLDLGIKSKPTEIIYIGTQEATKNTAFRKAIETHQQHFKYWIHPNSEGRIQVYKNKNNTKKHVQTIQLPLNNLWKSTHVQKHKPKESDNLHDCPILLPQAIDPKRALVTSDDEIFVISKEKNLFCFAGENKEYTRKGWDLMYHSLPFSSGVFEIGLANDGSYILLVFDLQSKMLSLINCQTKEIKQAHFKEWVSGTRKEFLFYNDVFYYFARNKCWLIDCHAEKIITSTTRPINFFELYDQRQKEVGILRRGLNFTSSLLKNIRSIELSLTGNLLFNGKHELLLNPYGVIKLERSQSSSDQYKAVNETNKKIFIFEDGSKIRLNSFGTIMLISSDDSLPIVYVPMIINAALGIGTELCFAGNDYYYRSSNTKGLAIMNTQKFWTAFVTPFIETIKLNVK